jgi:pilus assembly protein CpaC
MHPYIRQACLLAWFLGSSWVGHGAERLPDTLDMFVGDSRVVSASAKRVAVGNGKVISVSTIGSEGLLFLGEGVGTTIVQLWLQDGTRHRLLVRVTETDLASTLAAVQSLVQDVQELQVRTVGTRIVLESVVASDRASERAAAVAALYPGVAVNLVGKAIIDRMVHFDVKLVEVRRSKLRDLGIRWRGDIAGPQARIAVDTATPGVLQTRPTQAYLGLLTDIDSRIRLLEEVGDATVIAEPTLSCRSGGTARFVSGGEVPIPIVDKLGGTDVEYKEYGVILDVKPVADANGGIAARIDTEVSQIDESQRVLGVPGFLKRRSAADITMRDGETLIIAGLVNRLKSVAESGLPGLRRAPGVGRAFRARVHRDDSTELIVLLTPRVVTPEPAAPNDAQAFESTQRSRLEAARAHLRPVDGKQ